MLQIGIGYQRHSRIGVIPRLGQIYIVFLFSHRSLPVFNYERASRLDALGFVRFLQLKAAHLMPYDNLFKFSSVHFRPLPL